MKNLYLFFALALLVLLSACSLADDITPPPGLQQPVVRATQAEAPIVQTFPQEAPNPQAGEPVYVEKCLPCHGATGQGDGPQAAQLPNPAAPLGSPELARQATPAGWFAMVTVGNLERFMPHFASLSESQRWDVVAYSLSLSTSAAELENGREVYELNCAVCHGQAGKGDGPQASEFESMPDFTGQEFMALRSLHDFYTTTSQGAGAGMPAFADQLSDDQLWDVSNYLRTLSYATSDAVASTGSTPEAEDTPSGTPVASTEITTTETISPTNGEELPPANTITGKVTAGNTDEPVANQTVRLHGFDGMEIVYTDTAVTEPDGVYRFDDVEMVEERVFLAFTDYGGATYASSIVTASSDGAPMNLDIVVYETTTDKSALEVERLHIFFDFTTPESVEVIELYIITNRSDKAIVAENEGDPIAEFTVPEGAANLEFDSGELGGRYIETPGGFADTVSVRPNEGEYQVLYAFEMPYNRKLELNQDLLMPVNSIILLLPDEGVSVKSEQLTDAGVRPVQGQDYRMFNGGPVAAGSSLSLTLSGQPGSSSSLGLTSNDTLIIGLAAFGLVLILAGVWLWRNNRMEEAEADEEEALEPEAEQDAESLMDAIIALDDLYKEGKLPEEAYRQRRAELKERLKTLQS